MWLPDLSAANANKLESACCHFSYLTHFNKPLERSITAGKTLKLKASSERKYFTSLLRYAAFAGRCLFPIQRFVDKLVCKLNFEYLTRFNPRCQILNPKQRSQACESKKELPACTPPERIKWSKWSKWTWRKPMSLWFGNLLGCRPKL